MNSSQRINRCMAVVRNLGYDHPDPDVAARARLVNRALADFDDLLVTTNARIAERNRKLQTPKS